ncbi:MAG TPA: helix-turn-helix transcriptional regulator [Candidatus Faecousia faecigallinarum]|nr:helix-turn-helix transcriptional regulator [Candidatus Faecousia faecigallinarum]
MGRVIRRIRRRRGLSQEVVSGLAGIARTHLTMIENGSKQANLETVWKIALALDMQPSELIRQVEEEIQSTGQNETGVVPY